MLERAESNKGRAKSNNVFFVESRITQVALPDAEADCIISNCVVNLVPEAQKQLVFNEMFRLLKPGGRVAISDILTRNELPEELKRNMALYVGCIAGASQVKDYEKYLREAGFGGTWLFSSLPLGQCIWFGSFILTSPPSNRNSCRRRQQ
jgi:arsenite methyltransferase